MLYKLEMLAQEKKDGATSNKGGKGAEGSKGGGVKELGIGGIGGKELETGSDKVGETEDRGILGIESDGDDSGSGGSGVVERSGGRGLGERGRGGRGEEVCREREGEPRDKGGRRGAWL